MHAGYFAREEARSLVAMCMGRVGDGVIRDASGGVAGGTTVQGAINEDTVSQDAANAEPDMDANQIVRFFKGIADFIVGLCTGGSES